MSFFSSFLNRKPCRRVLVLALVLVVIPCSGRMFYLHKLDFARRISVARQQHINEERKAERVIKVVVHEEEEKRLLEGNPLADGGRR